MPVNMKYAHIEQERRYLLQAVPTDMPIVRTLFIQDRYFPDSTLRLRLIEEDGKEPVHKLGQKVRVDDRTSLKIAHTSMYINSEEFELLASLPTKRVEKTRSLSPIGQSTLAVDVFGGELRGLVMAEIDTGVSLLMPDSLPIDISLDVTNDERFTGGELARMTATQLQDLFREYGVK